MSIKSIEIVCRPCPKCEQLKTKINQIIRGMEIQNHVKIIYEFKSSVNLKDISQYGLNPSQTPVIIINGIAEFAGRIEFPALKLKLESLNRY